MALLAKVLPRDYMEHIYNQIRSIQTSEKEKMAEIAVFLERKRKSAPLAAQNPHNRKKTLTAYAANMAALSQGHDRARDTDCRRDFRLLGCI